jgi:hypothetical protein
LARGSKISWTNVRSITSGVGTTGPSWASTGSSSSTVSTGSGGGIASSKRWRKSDACVSGTVGMGGSNDSTSTCGVFGSEAFRCAPFAGAVKRHTVQPSQGAQEYGEQKPAYLWQQGRLSCHQLGQQRPPRPQQLPVPSSDTQPMLRPSVPLAVG